MKRCCSRLIALILALSMCLSLISATAWAAEVIPQEADASASSSLEPKGEDASASASLDTQAGDGSVSTEPDAEQKPQVDSASSSETPEEETASEEESGHKIEQGKSSNEMGNEAPVQEDCPNSWRYDNGKKMSSSDSQITTQDMEPSEAVSRGIDVSKYQGSIDWATVKNNIDFAIIRCGFGDDYSSQDDERYLENALACEKYGIPYGVYIYAYATNAQMARSEANHVLRLVKGRTLSLPIYYDLEDNSIRQNCSNDQILSNTKIFCDMIENAGYSVGIYANRDWWTNYLTSNEYDRWQRWYAQYNTRANYSKNFVIWQYSEHGSVPGIAGEVDMNYSRVSYSKNTVPTITGANSPGTLTVGSVFSIKGTVSSGQKLTSVTAGVYDANGNMKTGKSANPNSTSYSIVGLDNEVYFNHLTPGVYRYQVSAEAGGKTTVLLNKDFIVLANSDTISSGTYMIESCGNSGLVAGVGDNSNVQLTNKGNLDSQLFEVTSIGGGYYHLKSLETGKNLDVSGGGGESGANVQVYSPNDSGAQKWQILPVMDGYALVPQCGTSNCLDVYGAVFNNGTNLQVYTAHLDNLAQRFKLVPASTAKTNLSTCAVTLSQNVYTYDGTAKTPTVNVKDVDKTLTKGSDYDVSYCNNVEIGTATVTVIGKGSYTGSVERTFTIIRDSAPAPTTGDATFTVGSVSGAPGKQVVVPVSITKNPGIAGFALDVEYDHNLLTLTNATAVSSLGGTLTRNSDCVSWFAEDNVQMTGKLFELTFTVAASTGDGTTDVTLAMHDGKPNVTDEDSQNLTAAFQKGTVTIRSFIPGDVTGDGDVTIADVVKVNRHVAGKITMTAAEQQAADVTGDGDVTIGDVVKLNRYVAGKVKEL